ncbi:hypothetical protein BsWGS_07366 [Bradybaena similaris]
MSVLLIAMFPSAPLAASDKTKTELCEYDLDMASKKVKVVCQGSPSMVNVYATSALLETNNNKNKNNNNFAENAYDRHVLDIKKTVPSFLHTETQPSEGFPGRDSDIGQQLHPPERMTYPESDDLSLEEDEDRENVRPGFRGAFDDALLNITERLQHTSYNLSSCFVTIRKISNWLGHANVVLKPDTDNLQQLNNSVTELKDGIFAALANRATFMSDILTNRSQELEKMAHTTSAMMDVTVDGLKAALAAHDQATEEVSTLTDQLRRLRKRLSKEITRYEYLHGHHVAMKTAEKCPKQISAIGSGTAKDMQWATGAYMVQSANPKEHRSIFIMADTGPSSELREYYSSAEVDYNLVNKFITLPFSCSGTGHVVYRRHFYCHKTDTNLIVKYNMKRAEMVSELALPGARFGGTQPYSSGANTDIDLAVDELGLWAIYATDATAGNISIAKIDHKKMELGRTYITTFPKRQAGNAFMICGTLYATNSHSDVPTFVNYTYNTENNQEQWLGEGVLSFTNSASQRLGGAVGSGFGQRPSNSVMLSYDFRTSSLYSWNNGRVELFPVYFKESG